MGLTLVGGGTRSGKSARAEQLAAASGLPVRYVATADRSDPAMADRIHAHTARRPPGWTTVEAGIRLADAVPSADDACVLIDGLGTWIADRLHRAGAFDGAHELAVERACEEVVADVERLALVAAGLASVISVAEHSGQGVLPPDR